MCGIVGALSNSNVTDFLVNGLLHLEYRGYDSAGVALVNEKNNELLRVRCLGKVEQLAKAIQEGYPDLLAHTGIAHTRWATHGVPSEINAHPHLSENIVLVHNGIIENHEELRTLLKELGYSFTSQTDTEVVVHLVNYLRKNSNRLLAGFGAKASILLRERFGQEVLEAETVDLFTAVRMAVCIIKGAYGLVALDASNKNELVAARSGSPLVIGLGTDGNYLASDQLALIEKTNKFIYLEEGDVARLTLDSVEIFDINAQVVEREVFVSTMKKESTNKGDFDTFMEKEIFEQPQAVIDTMEGRIIKDNVLIDAIGTQARELLQKVEHVTIVACGTSYHAGLVAKYWIEEFSGVSCDVEIASEYRYRKTVTRPNSLILTISQSGETADLLAALRKAKQTGFLCSMTICNTPTSSLVRESDLVYLTRCGVEIGVASTKAFTSQLVCLLMFATALGNSRKFLTEEQNSYIVHALNTLPRKLEQALQLKDQIKELAQDFSEISNALFIGRDLMYPIAKEADLKLKEISYIHSEAFAGGELKHGPLALVDDKMTVFCLAPANSLLDKMNSNIEEVAARNGRLVIFTDTKANYQEKEGQRLLVMPDCLEVVSPIFYTIPLQLMALYIATNRGCDADKPRNLAKSVTVE